MCTICILQSSTITLTVMWMNVSKLHRNKTPSNVCRKSGQYTMNHGNSNPTIDKVSFNRSGSQDSLDDLSLDDYWLEVENIKKNRDGSQEEQEVVVREPDEGELEEEWLKGAGLASLFGEGAADSHESAVFLSTLTKTQSAAVQRRLDTFSQTLRKKNKHTQIPDVRDVFKLPDLKLKNEGVNGFQASETKNEDSTLGQLTCQDGGKGSKAQSPLEDDLVPETAINIEISFAEQATKLKEFPSGKDDDSLLPNFQLQQDKTGTTKIGDLAPQDMKLVTRYAHVELSALFDTLGTELKLQRPAKLRVTESGVFKVPLSILLEQDQKKVPGTKVPLILQYLIKHIEKGGLDTEGVLRIPGVASRIKMLCQELEAKFYEGTFNWDTVKQHDAASLLKYFIRELPLPLLTVEYMKAFHSVQFLPTKKHRLQALNLLIILLPDIHRDALKALLEFLQRVVDHREQNKMTLKNVAMVMAPNLISIPLSHIKTMDQFVVESAARTASVMLFMIKYQKLLWTIPKFIVSQLRKQNSINQKKMSKEKAMKKLLKRMAYDREKTERNFNDGFIRVQAPQFSKVSMAVQLSEELKAGDILSRFLNQDSGESRPIKKDEVCLYEIGGNIGERCLEENTYMNDLYLLNPNAEWVIKSKPAV
uniref:Rho GTPase activating protein 18 n=1 Tax=Leptobrachium leishanense TaxID=445787 RepID=A0A8C5Q4F8_9ANUR